MRAGGQEAIRTGQYPEACGRGLEERLFRDRAPVRQWQFIRGALMGTGAVLVPISVVEGQENRTATYTRDP